MTLTTNTGPTVTPVTLPVGHTQTGLDQLVAIIISDPALTKKISASDIAGGASAADAMNALIVEAIRATGIANNNDITSGDVRDLNAWLRATHLKDWANLHGDDEDRSETGFHLVQNDGAKTELYGKNAVNTVADGIYHLGFKIDDDRLENEDGNDNASLKDVAQWLSNLLAADLSAGSLKNAAVNRYVSGSTSTGLDQLVNLITADTNLNSKVATSEIKTAALAADAMNALILQAIRATGVANNGDVSAGDVRDLNAWLRTNALEQWKTLHGDDEDCEETGFHLVQNDGAKTQLYGKNAVDTVADGLYHLGFMIKDGQLANEDGNANASLKQVSEWLNGLLANDLAAGTLKNDSFNPYIQGSTSTGLDQLVKLITSDSGLARNISAADLHAGASAADAMNALILQAIIATGVANNGDVSAGDVRDLNAWLRSNAMEKWKTLHGDDEDHEETGFHLVQNDGAKTELYGKNAVDTVADGLYHLGFKINDDRLENEDGNQNASLKQVSDWLNSLLSTELASGTLKNASVNPYIQGSTGTGLDQLVKLITSDSGLACNISAADLYAGASAADAMNALILQAIKATGVANNGDVSVADVRDLNAWLRANAKEQWKTLHGDDEKNSETGFHLVQDDGAKTQLYGKNAVATVADGLYHLGFKIDDNRLQNEDGNNNASLKDVSQWLGSLLSAELAGGSLANAAVNPYAQGSTGTGLDKLVNLITTDTGLIKNISTSDIYAGAKAADSMNGLIVSAIKATNAADGGRIDTDEVRELNARLRTNHLLQWTKLHGDDEGKSETGFHLVQNDGANTELFGRNAVNTVADGLYHLGILIEDKRLQNEDGDKNASLNQVSDWLNDLLAADLANGSLVTLVGTPAMA